MIFFYFIRYLTKLYDSTRCLGSFYIKDRKIKRNFFFAKIFKRLISFLRASLPPLIFKSLSVEKPVGSVSSSISSPPLSTALILPDPSLLEGFPVKELVLQLHCPLNESAFYLHLISAPVQL